MSRPWQRAVVALAGFGAATLLAGCEITGTVDVRSETEVVADLTITHAEADCLGLQDFQGLEVTGTPDPSGNQICRARGTLDLDGFEAIGVKVSRIGEYLVLDVAVPRRIVYAPLDLRVTFPGQVVEPGAGQASGNQVTVTGAMVRTTTGGTRIVAMAHPGPEWWVVGLVAGTVSGMALTLAGLWLLRRQRRLQPTAQQSAAQPGFLDDGQQSGAEAGFPDDGQQWVGTYSPAPEQPAAEVPGPSPARDPAYDASFAPPPGHQAAPRQPDSTSLPAAATPPPEAADDLIWARPEEHPEVPPAANDGVRGQID